MLGTESTLPGQRLVIEASVEGALRFAIPTSSTPTRLTQVKQVDVGALPTFTDGLQQFERESGIPLRGLDCALAIAGAISGDTLSLDRSRWIISRTGLEAVFGNPVTIINDVAARAWAMKSGTAKVEPLREKGLLNLDKAGRYVMVIVEEGVNAAIIDVDRQGRTHILETEAGHIEFAPSDKDEEELAKAARGLSPVATWEDLLMLDSQNPAWQQAVPDSRHESRVHILAAILGRYCVNLMHAYGAWHGVMITGTRGGQLSAGGRDAFAGAFKVRRNFNRLISNCPVWHVEQRDAVLIGLAECLAEMRSVQGGSPSE